MWSLNCYIWNQRKFIGLSNTSHVDSIDRFRRSVSDKVKPDVCILQQGYDTKIKY